MTNDCARLEVLVINDFFDERLCDAVVQEMEATMAAPARLATGGQQSVDATVRRTEQVELSRATQRLVRNRMLEAASQFERHFGNPITNATAPHFLQYGPDSFFKPHNDGEYEGALKVTAIVMLSRPSTPDVPGDYAGGELVFYAREDTTVPACRLRAARGTLVAFRPHMMHEVTPITAGTRRSTVCWLS